MGKIINLLFSLAAYFCVATVITLALLLGYMWQTHRLVEPGGKVHGRLLELGAWK